LFQIQKKLPSVKFLRSPGVSALQPEI